MVKQSDNRNSVSESEAPHRCNLSCLGPLTFHCHAVGAKVSLSQWGRVAERRSSTFKNGLVFSSRPLKIQERIRLRVENDVHNWHGALRVGFTNVSPSGRSLPLPTMAIPDLTNTPGHWAAPVAESFCTTGSELEVWVSHGGTVYITSNNSRPHKLLTGVDLSQPLWAMIDIYGQTCSISLLGSEKKELLYTRRSCPAPELRIIPDNDLGCRLNPDADSDDSSSCPDVEVTSGRYGDCVVCMGREATVALTCGHRCLCRRCFSKVARQFGTCPLCRHRFEEPSGESRRITDLSC